MPQIVKRGALKGFSGKVEDLNLVMRQMKSGETVFARLPEKPKVPIRSPKIMTQRLFLAATNNAWKAFKPYLQESFEREHPGQRMRDLFIKFNIKDFGVYLTREQRMAGAQVLNHFQVSSGPIPEVEVALSQDETLFLTNVAVGDLQLSAATTVKEFALAVGLNSQGVFLVNNNPDLPSVDRDSLSVLFAYQFLDPVSLQPTIRVQQYQVPLVLSGWAAQTPVAACLPMDQVQVVERELQGQARRVLAFPAGDRKMCAVIHSRRRGSEAILCSRQFLVGQNSILDRFLTVDAKREAYESYGCVNWHDAYNPDNRSTIPAGQQAPGLTQQAPASFIPAPSVPLPPHNPEEDGTGNTGPTEGRQVTLTCAVTGTVPAGASVSPASVSVAVGQQATFTAVVPSGYQAHWSTGATGSTITVTATANSAYTVEFRPTSVGGGDGEDGFSR